MLILFVLLRRGTGAGVSGLLYLVPAVTAVLAVPVLRQPVDAEALAGLAVTLVGVVLVNGHGTAAGRQRPASHRWSRRRTGISRTAPAAIDR